MERRMFLGSIAAAVAAAVATVRTAAGASPAGDNPALKPAVRGSGPLWSWTTAQLADAIRRGKVSSREATRSCLQRLQDVNPRANAVAEVLEVEALKAADEADRRRARGGKLPPLLGVPITTKINADLAGHPTTNGVVAFKEALAKDDSASVANLRTAGAVIIGRSNVPAFSFRWFTDNDLYGATLNPWDPTLTPGGSSGGAACAVAVGIGALAHGSDIAGSVRYPAYACGVTGIRPSLGAVASYNPSATAARTITIQVMSVQGLLARSVSDLRLSLPALAARDVRDPWWQPMPIPPQGKRKGVRVALLSQLEGYEADPEVAAGLANAAKALGDAGYEVEEASPPHFTEIAELWSPLVMAESRLGFAQVIEKLGDPKVKKAMATWSISTNRARRHSGEYYTRRARCSPSRCSVCRGCRCLPESSGVCRPACRSSPTASARTFASTPVTRSRPRSAASRRSTRVLRARPDLLVIDPCRSTGGRTR